MELKVLRESIADAHVERRRSQILTTFGSEPAKVRSSKSSGSGCFSVVNKATIPGFVVKEIEYPHRDGWVLWALHVMGYKQPPEWAPKIAALTLDRASGKLYALIEELSELHPGESEYANLNIMQRDHPLDDLDEVEDRFEEEFPGFTTALVEICEGFDDDYYGIRLDLHRGNYMHRNGVTVITDPLTIKDRQTDCWVRPDDEKASAAMIDLLVSVADGDPRISVI